MQKLDEVVDDYTTKVESTDDVIECKRLRSERKTPKQIVKKVYNWVVRGKSKVENEIGLALMAVNIRKYVVRG